MLGFDRGGAYPQVFTHCREQDVHWVTYRRAPLAVPAMLPVITIATIGGRQRTIAWAEEKVQLKDYGEARQLTLFEHGRVVLQILTSDFDACPADILAWLKSRWREENFLKYASENYGIDKICDYAAAIEVNTKITANPARKTANTAVRDAENELAAAERALAALLADPDTTAAAKNAAIPAAERAITAARRNLQGRDRRPGRDPREAARRPDRPRRPDRGAARRATRPADGAAAARAQRRALARHPPQRLPARRRRIPRRHPRRPSSAAWPEPSPSPPPRSPSPSRPPPNPASHGPSPCSPTRSTPSHRPSPATTGPSPTASTRSRAFNSRPAGPSGDLGPWPSHS